MMAGGGFAMMAWTEAQRRVGFKSICDGPKDCPGTVIPKYRHDGCPHCVYASILDTANRFAQVTDAVVILL